MFNSTCKYTTAQILPSILTSTRMYFYSGNYLSFLPENSDVIHVLSESGDKNLHIELLYLCDTIKYTLPKYRYILLCWSVLKASRNVEMSMDNGCFQ